MSCCGKCSYANDCSSWTRRGNVTPDNSAVYQNKVIACKPIKENFKEGFSCNKNNTYLSLGQTWSKQAPYTLG